MAGSVLSNLIVKIGADTSGFFKEIEKAQKSIDRTVKSMESVGKTLTTRVTLPLAAAGAAFAAITVSAAKAADELTTMSGKTGISIKRLQELKYVTSQTDVELNTVINSAMKLSKRVVESASGSQVLSEAFGTLGINVREADGSFREVDDLLPEIIGRLASMKDITQRNALAMVLFEEGGAQLAPLLNAGSDEIARLTAEAHKMGLVMSEDSVNSLAKFNDEMDAVRQQFSTIGVKIASGFMPILQGKLLPLIQDRIIPALDRFAGFVGGLIDSFMSLPEPIQAVSLGFLGLVAGLGPILIGAANLIKAWGTISTIGAGLAVKLGLVGTQATAAAVGAAAAGTAASAATPAVTGLGTAFSGMLGPIGLVVSALAVFGTWAYNATLKAREARSGMDSVMEGMSDQWTYFEDQLEQDISLPTGTTAEEKEALFNVYRGASGIPHISVDPEIGSAPAETPSPDMNPDYRYESEQSPLDVIRQRLSAIGTEADIVKAKLDLYMGGLAEGTDKTYLLNLQLEEQKDELALAGDKVKVLEGAVAQMTATEGAASQNTRQLTLDLLTAQKAYQDITASIADTNAELERQALIKKGLVWKAEGRVGTKQEIINWAAQTYIQRQVDAGQEIDSAKLDKMYGRDVTEMATGGIIMEPIWGFGLSSRRSYLFGESGPERVTPMDRNVSGIDYERLGDVIATKMISALHKAPMKVNVSTGPGLRTARLAAGV